VWELLDEENRQAVVVVENFADGAASEVDLSEAMMAAFQSSSHLTNRAPSPFGQSDLFGFRRDYSVNPATPQAFAAGASLALSQIATRLPPNQSEVIAARCVAGSVAYSGITKGERSQKAWHKFEAEEFRYQAAILRDIMGGVFRPVAIDPRWLTSTVTSLAAGIYAERAFDRMPILADALEDAGCDNSDVLTHCRGDGPHVRGCWVVDLLLGKE
jgi:hypothetical protein